GFRLPENFARPYSSASITEFWRRWHISLSRWFRDYLYIPLGGNRLGVQTTYRNLWIVFALVGLWHGANWTFLLWGLYHGTALVIERRRGWGVAEAEPGHRLGRRALTLLIVVFGWVLFRSPNLGTALVFLQHMVILDLDGLTDVVAASLTNQRLAILLLAALVFLLPARPITGRYLESVRSRPATVLRVGVMTVGLFYSTLLVATGTFSPFLYYRF
ncbi:MAG: MBOAT family O-acyltransferase, partial [Pseudonocardiaceae bacterium]